MKKNYVVAAGIVLAMCSPTAALAREDGMGLYGGVSAGYHKLDIADDIEDELGTNIEISDSSPIVGGFAGVNFEIDGNVFGGFEGNLHMGTDAIDYEYGGSARLGIRSANGGKFYVRGGYQQVDIDLAKLFDIPLPAGALDSVDDSDGDYLVGVGADLPLGPSAVRFNLDTVGFETLRATIGLSIGF